MKKVAVRWFAAAVLFAHSAAAHVVNFNPPGNATGVTGLLIGGATYDVTFEYGAYNDLFAVLPPVFLGNFGRALFAAEALTSALNTPVLVDTVGTAPSPRDQEIGIPFAIGDLASDAVTAALLCKGACSPDTSWGTVFFGWYVTDPFTWAVFARVPEPGTLALLSLALAGLGFARRRGPYRAREGL